MHFHWRFPAPPALEASGNGTTARAVAFEQPVEMDFHRRFFPQAVQKIPENTRK
jgi:hypothetical protein